MSAHKVRTNKTCLNCGFYVEKTYCPNCGQENTESRKSFHHLFSHFIADLVHYDSSLWKTVRYLLFSPAKLSIEYMNGKRRSYVDPVKLYIFISFITFFIPVFLPDFKAISVDSDISYSADVVEVIKEEMNDSLPDPSIFGYKSSAELDSVQRSLPDEQKMSKARYLVLEGAIKFFEDKSRAESMDQIRHLFVEYFPKLLFIYMPFFAFWGWLLHIGNKKGRKGFDSGVFTLHYFSFMLLLITIYNLLECVCSYFGLELISQGFLFPIMLLYIVYYFYKANRKFYEEGWVVSSLKGTFFIGLNFMTVIFVLMFYFLYLFSKVYY